MAFFGCDILIFIYSVHFFLFPFFYFLFVLVLSIGGRSIATKVHAMPDKFDFSLFAYDASLLVVTAVSCIGRSSHKMLFI